MKNIKVSLILIGLTLGITSVASRNIEPSTEPDCYDEARQLTIAANLCVQPNIEFEDIIDRIVEFRNQTITATKFSQSITEYCMGIKMAASCSLEKAANVHLSCQNFPKIEYQINTFRLVGHIETEICSEQIVYKIANDRGFTCFENSNFKTCLRSRIQRTGAKGHFLDNAHICSFLQSFQDCLPQIFDQCEHDGEIVQYADQVRTALNTLFCCDVQ